ncbi:hypothetical protein [Pedobacter nutrimenti]|uniref:Ig-like domain-containing protein n=1 Tax=Pedobacter nutrimenti TaxID=1241337 RepID=A0A318UDH6_9SPHI|nr:hypothetical protein [Pedobacter nutrimenti]PYF68434.1 hypothetical protein B0O44_11218 [Pedobacter nutrimenti]
MKKIFLLLITCLCFQLSNAQSPYFYSKALGANLVSDYSNYYLANNLPDNGPKGVLGVTFLEFLAKGHIMAQEIVGGKIRQHYYGISFASTNDNAAFTISGPQTVSLSHVVGSYNGKFDWAISFNRFKPLIVQYSPNRIQSNKYLNVTIEYAVIDVDANGVGDFPTSYSFNMKIFSDAMTFPATLPSKTSSTNPRYYLFGEGDRTDVISGPGAYFEPASYNPPGLPPGYYPAGYYFDPSKANLGDNVISYSKYTLNDAGPTVITKTINVCNAPPIAPIISTDASSVCSGSLTKLTANGSNIIWSNGAEGNEIMVGPGTYYANSTNACGSSPTSNQITITARSIASAPSISASGNTNLCNGSTVILTATGSNITWSNGQTGNSITVNSAGNYYAVSTNECGTSSASNTITITTGSVPTPPTISANGSTNLCNGRSVTLSATGSNITWSNGQTGNSISVNSAGSYYAVSSNDCGNSANSNVITVNTGNTPTAPTVSASGSTALCNGATVTLTATGSNITWSNGQTGNSITVNSAGNYYVTTSNSCGTSIASNTISVTTNSTPTAPAISISGDLCNGSAILSSNDGMPVNWYLNNTFQITSITIPGSPGTYYATRSNTCGESTSSNSIIAEYNKPEAPTSFTLSIGMPDCGQNFGTITVNNVTAPPGTTIQYAVNGITNWQTSNSFSIAPGTYDVMVRAVKGTCVSDPKTIQGTIIRNDAPATPVIESLFQPSCTTPTGSITLSYVNGASYSKDNGQNYQESNSFTGLTPGNYVFKIKNAVGCESNQLSQTITTPPTKPSPPVVNSITHPNCTTSTGTININIIPGAKYSIDYGLTYQTSNIFSNLSPGTYVLRIQTSNGCESSGSSVTINNQPDLPGKPVISSVTKPTCDNPTGSFSVEMGAMGLQYGIHGVRSWQFSNVFDNLPPGEYRVAIRTLEGCESSETLVSLPTPTAQKPNAPVLSSSGGSLCNGASITLTTSGVNLKWYKDQVLVAQNVTSLVVNQGGTFYVTQTNSCGTSDNSNQIQIAAPSTTPGKPSMQILSGSKDLCNGGSVQFQVSAIGRVLIYKDGNLILNGNDTYSFSINSEGIYKAKVQNDCGESDFSDPITVTVTNLTTPKITSNSTMIFSNENITIKSDIPGNTEWFKDGVSLGISNETLIINEPGIYKSRRVSANGCTSPFSNEIVITKYSIPPVITTPTDPDVKVDPPDSNGNRNMYFCQGKIVTLTAPTADAYTWLKDGAAIPGQTSKTISISSEGTYSVRIVKDGNTFTTPYFKVTVWTKPNQPSINY